MRPRVFRKGIRKHLHRYSESDFTEDWADQVIGTELNDLGCPPNGPTAPVAT